MQPLSQYELSQLQQLYSRAQQANQIHSPGAQPNPMMQASINPPNRVTQAMMAQGYMGMDLSRPTPEMPISDNIGLSLNDRVISFTGLTANTETSQRIGFDTPAYGFAITAGVRETDTGAFPVGANPLNQFRVQFLRTNSFLFQTAQGMGATICGTAERPRWMSGPAWEFTTGSVLVINLTPLIDNLEVDINVWTLEMIGPTNIA